MKPASVVSCPRLSQKVLTANIFMFKSAFDSLSLALQFSTHVQCNQSMQFLFDPNTALSRREALQCCKMDQT